MYWLTIGRTYFSLCCDKYYVERVLLLVILKFTGGLVKYYKIIEQAPIYLVAIVDC